MRGPRALLVSAVLVWMGGLAMLFSSSPQVRPSAIAGSWYPGDRLETTLEVAKFLRQADDAPALPGRPVALIVPHAGWRFSGRAAAAAFRTLRRGDFARVVLIAPSHHKGFSGFSVPESRAYATPLGEVSLDRETIDLLRDGSLVSTVRGADEPEHAIEIEVPFLQFTLGDFKLVPILAGQTLPGQEKALADRLAKLHDGKTLFVFSTDFTHYGPRFSYTPFGSNAALVREKIRGQNDEAISLLRKKDGPGFRAFLDRTDDTICGRHGLSVLLELLPQIAPKAQASLLGYYASIDIPGFSDANSVSYVSMAFTEGDAAGGPALGAVEPPPGVCPPKAPPLPEALGKKLVKLARARLRTELKGTFDLARELAGLPSPSPELDRLQAAFVTLSRTDPGEIRQAGKLRGCIGQVMPTYPLYEAVLTAARGAALEDPRFPKVGGEELDRLTVEVTVLSPPHPVDSWQDIIIGTHGIVLEKNGRRALFLPQVAVEQKWGIEQTLDALAHKAGLPSGAWREGAHFQVFQGQVFHEEETH